MGAAAALNEPDAAAIWRSIFIAMDTFYIFK
jgi:hypothetical protein